MKFIELPGGLWVRRDAVDSVSVKKDFSLTIGLRGGQIVHTDEYPTEAQARKAAYQIMGLVPPSIIER